MGKIVFWLVVVFVVLFALRLWNAAKARPPRDAGERRRDDPAKSAASAGAAMVRCVECGVFLPKADARPVPQGFHCERVNCAQHRPPGR